MRTTASLAMAAAIALLCATSATRAETILRLSETASVQAAPDELAGTLRAEATAASAASAQTEVNRDMQAALTRSHEVAQVTAATAAYAVWQAEPPGAGGSQWRASQTLELSSHAGPTLLGLVGALQQQGLVVGQLAWRLSSQASEAARQQALHKALGRLRSRAEEAAGLLDLRFGSFKEVRLEPAPSQVFPRAMMAAATAAPGPSVEAGPIEVTATVSADVVLLARAP